jgi:hypothetical protein
VQFLSLGYASNIRIISIERALDSKINTEMILGYWQDAESLKYIYLQDTKLLTRHTRNYWQYTVLPRC